jgi:hypothetical protein
MEFQAVCSQKGFDSHRRVYPIFNWVCFFRTLWVQVIRRGDPPKIVTSGISVEYSLVNNSTVTGKTDFWQYVYPLFGVNLPLGIGLTGNGLSGRMQPVGDHFEATGIPALPYSDKNDDEYGDDTNWNPYQTAVVTMKYTDPSGKGGKKSQKITVVVPVSDEVNCAKCHMQGMDGTVNLPNGGVESIYTNILAVHDFYHGPGGQSDQGPSLVAGRPVLCAKCHSDNALGAPGDGTSKSLSEAMHGWHSQFPDAGCYDCHPGAVTQCTRTAIGGMGYSGDTPSCPSCHGDMQAVGASIAQGRKPWLEEPTCEQCHGKNYSTDQPLYRHSKGHGGVYCSACHNSPHAWWPSRLWADNLQPVKLQKSRYSIGDCKICHTQPRVGDNPHAGYY